MRGKKRQRSKIKIRIRARITFYIGVIVAVLNIVQLIISFEAIRFIGIAVGLFFIFRGLKAGWTQNKNLTVIVGHIAITIGSIVTAYAIHQIPFLKVAPSYLEILDLPLFWGIFIIWGGNCMITHGYCSCAIKMHEMNNSIKTGK
ncbi:MAG: hypothetical protein U0W24_00315 [Bacteroidales bacterium]